MYEFRLYVLGKLPNSFKAIEEIKAILEEKFDSQYTLDIIDIVKSPQKIITDKVFVTPTLVKVNPKPEIKIIGSFRNRAKILNLLDGYKMENEQGC